MKNDYEIRGEVTAIFVQRRDGKVFEILIDTEDLPRLKDLRTTWSVWIDSNTKRGYAVANFYENNMRTMLRLNRWILDAKSPIVDHINHNTLDNRKSNLREVTVGENLQNREGATKRSKSKNPWSTLVC